MFGKDLASNREGGVVVRGPCYIAMRTQHLAVGLPPEHTLPDPEWQSGRRRIGIGGDGNADARQLCCAGGWVEP